MGVAAKPPTTAESRHVRPGRVARAYATTVVRLRFAIIALWLALAAAAVWVPLPLSTGGTELAGFIDDEDPAVATEVASSEAFGFPLLGRTVLVQRDPDGLSPYDQAQTVLRGLGLANGEYEDAGPIVGALPIVNTFALFPGSTERGTTALTYLFMDPEAGLWRQTGASERWGRNHFEAEDAYIGVTGSVPARVQQARILDESLHLVELATLAAVAVIVGLHFRSVVAPLLAIGTAAIAFLIAARLAEVGGALTGTPPPDEMRPLILALLLGVVTDYVIFYVAGMQRAVRDGMGRIEAACTATGQYGPIVAVAGVTVAAGTAALLVADSPFFATMGPALGMSVLVGVVVAATLVPAVMAVLGKRLFWPARHLVQRGQPLQAQRDRGIRFMTRRPVALLVVIACTALLTAASLPLRDLRLGVGFVPSLPASDPKSQAAAAAAEGFAPGIVSPSVLLVQGEGVTSQREELAALGSALEAQPGVAGVLGPGDLPAELEPVLLAPGADAARFLVVLEDEPMGATAITTLRDLREQVPALLETVGLAGLEVGFGGDTALASALVGVTEADLGRIAVAALLVNFLILVLFLRALVAPLYLLASSVLALTASLGIATWVFQDLLGHDGLTFYVPFAAAVLLVALGSDYNLFGVGSIWAQAREVPLREAIVRAVPQSSRAITAAAVTLALSFGMLALVPLRSFRELAFVMAVGIVLDAIVVRTLLVPTMLILVGRVSGWPGHALSPDVDDTPTRSAPRPVPAPEGPGSP